MRIFATLAVSVWLTLSVCAQSCPSQESSKRKRRPFCTGTLTYHNTIREWLGLRLDKPTCGQKEIQLIFANKESWRKGIPSGVVW